MNNQKNKYGKTIIVIGALVITFMFIGISSAGLVQGQVNPNGTLWIVQYQTPTGTHYPQPFQSFYSNNLTLTVYSPSRGVEKGNISVLSYQSNTNKTVYENQTITVLPQEVQTFELKIPQETGKQKLTIKWDNTSVTYFIQTYKPVKFPFGNNPLGMLGLIGIIMLIFTGINIGITEAILRKTKYFPRLSQRIWAVIILMTGLIIYQISTNYYYDLTGEDWAFWLIPLWLFNLLMILSSFPDKTQEELLIHVKQTAGSDIETGLYAIRTAEMTGKEDGKYPIPNRSGKEYIDSRSYTDFIKRLFNIHIPIIMECEEQPDKMENVKSFRIARKGWKFRDRANKEHPFSEAVLINPLLEPPKMENVKIPKYPDENNQEEQKETEEQTKVKNKWLTRRKKMIKFIILKIREDGRHMKEAEYFLANYITASESGIEIHKLHKKLAITQAEKNTKAYEFQQEMIDYLFYESGKEKEYRAYELHNYNVKEEKEKKENNKTEEGRNDKGTE